MAGMNGAGMRITGAQIRAARERGFEQVLPESGYPVRLRHLEPEALLQQGEVPDLLSPLVEAMLFEGLDADRIEAQLSEALKPESFSLERTEKLIRYINLMCAAALVYPRMETRDIPEGTALEDDVILPEDLPLADRFFIWSMSLQPVEVLRRFRYSKPGATVEPVPDGDEDRVQAEPIAAGA